MASRRRFSVMLAPQQLAALRRNEKEAGITMSMQISQAIDEWLREKTAKPTRKRSKTAPR
jgi:hypothetical protein